MLKYYLTRFFSQYIYILYLHSLSGLSIGRNIKIIGIPIIIIQNMSKIILADHVSLNSDNILYHLNMHSPVKLIADGELSSIKIGEQTRLHGVCIHARSSIMIGCRCLIAANSQIIDNSGHDICLENPKIRNTTTGNAKPVEIGDDVWIGGGCYIMPGVKIGNGSVIGAGSVVTKSIPERAFAAGNPAIVRRKI